MSVQVCTLFPEFPEKSGMLPLTLHMPMETQTPQSGVPLFLVHSLSHPFCSNLLCECQEHRTHKQALLTLLAQGTVTLRATSAFADRAAGGSDAHS